MQEDQQININDGIITQECDKSIITIFCSNKEFSIACYQEISNSILTDSMSYSMEDLDNIISKVKLICEPTLFILHPRIISNKSLLDLILCGLDGSPDFYRYKALKSTSWNIDTTRELIKYKLLIRSLVGKRQSKLNPNENYMKIASVIDVECESLTQSLGALVGYMIQNAVQVDEGIVVAATISSLPSHDYLRLDDSSFKALQIFSEEIHPNVIKESGRSKEGFSLFSLFDRTRSLPGRKQLRNWMQRPFNDAERINQRLDGVGLVVCQTNRDFISDVVKLLRHVHDLPRTLLRIKKVEATYVDWCRLQSTLEAALGVCEQMSHFTQQGDKAEDHRQYIDGLLSPISTQSVYQAHQLVTHAIDTKESFSTQSVVIRHGYDAQLDHERELFENLESELTEAAHRVLEQVPLLQHVSVEYVPQIGYLVAVNRSEIHFLDTVSETDHRNTTALGGGTDAYAQVDTEMWSDSNAGRNYQNPVPSTAATAGTHYANQWEGQQNYQQPLDWNNFENEENGVHNDSPYHKKQRQQQYQSQSQPQSQAPIHSTTSPFQFVYAQEDIHYFKHAIVYELDESIGDIKSIIVDHQKQLLLKLEDDILDQEPSIQQVALMLANLDALISLGTIAFEMKLTRPQIVDDNVIVIKNGRHPLQELTVDCFVPNDTYLTVNKNIALITGPNSSGKSVYLKQVGMMVYLAHLGSWLPCDKAAIGLTDRIFTRIASLESNSNQFSSFSLDLNQVSKMLSQHTSRSLCLIDEFGKGTSPIDGIALLAAVINHFAEKKAKSVFVLHFTEALHPDVLSPAATACVSTFRMDTYTRPIEDFEVDALNSREEVLAQRGQSGSITGGRVSTADSTGYGAYDPTPLFKLRVGVSPSSEGIPCARNAGIPEHILTRAAVIKQCVTTKQAIHPVPTQRASILNNVNVHRLLTIFLMVKDWTVMLYNRIGGSTVTATATGGADQVNSIAEGSADGNNPSTNTNTSSSGTEGVTNFSLLQELKQLIRSHI